MRTTDLDDLLNEITPEEALKIEKKMLLAMRIDEGIKAKAWKKIDFAKAMNKVPSEISKWLSGTHSFNIDTLFDIEQVLGIQLINTCEHKPQSVNYYLQVSNSINSSDSTKYKSNMNLINDTKNNIGNKFEISTHN